jgi:hypothetical protein
MLVDRRLHPQRPSDPGEPLLFYVKESLAQVEHQIWLLRNIFWWYLLPPSISIMAYFIHSSWEGTKSWWGCILLSGLLGIFLFLVYYGIYLLNQWVVSKQLEPRRSDLQKLIDNLESESNAKDASEVMDLILVLSATDGNACLNPTWASWAENWNRLIPSWREVAFIVVPTLAGAYLGFRYPLPFMGPVFFQSVVAGVIPFEITFFRLCYLSAKRHKGQPLSGNGKACPNAPAMVTIAFILLISTLAFAAVISFFAASKSRQKPSLDAVSAQFDNNHQTIVCKSLRACSKRGLTLWRQVNFIESMSSPERVRPLFRQALNHGYPNESRLT